MHTRGLSHSQIAFSPLKSPALVHSGFFNICISFQPVSMKSFFCSEPERSAQHSSQRPMRLLPGCASLDSEPHSRLHSPGLASILAHSLHPPAPAQLLPPEPQVLLPLLLPPGYFPFYRSLTHPALEQWQIHLNSLTCSLVKNVSPTQGDSRNSEFDPLGREDPLKGKC